ncbi:hypothetical protein ACWGQT_00635 [Streptomyces yangpuensis]
MAESDHSIDVRTTKEIARRFLEAHPFLGGAEWVWIKKHGTEGGWPSLQEAVIDPVSEEESDGGWWRVNFTDPTGKAMHLGHATVLEGVRRCVYQDDPVPSVQAWLMKPPEQRSAESLPDAAVSAVCQRGVFEGKEPYKSAAQQPELF